MQSTLSGTMKRRWWQGLKARSPRDCANNQQSYLSKHLRMLCQKSLQLHQLWIKNIPVLRLNSWIRSGKRGSWFTRGWMSQPRYPSVVAANTGGGVLTKAGSVQSGTGVKYRWGSYHYLFLDRNVTPEECCWRGSCIQKVLPTSNLG